MQTDQSRQPVSPRIIQRLAQLKLKTTTDNDFYEISTFFFDHLGESDEFLSLGQRVRHPMLEQVLIRVASAAFGIEITGVSMLLIIHLPDQQFLHGSAIFKGRLCTFFYFEDIDIGLASCAASLTAETTMFSRFSVTTSRKSPTRSAN